MSRTRWGKDRLLEAKRKRKLHQLSQKFGVLDKLPEVIRTRWGFLKRRNAILSIGHGATLEARAEG